MFVSEFEDIRAPILFAVVTVMIIFSVEVPLGLGISKYESINSEDFAVLLLFVWLMKRVIFDRERIFTIQLSSLTIMFVFCSAWILFTFMIVLIRSPEPVTASALWLLKWFEVLVFFVCIQHLMTERMVSAVVNTILIGGSVIAAYSIFYSVFMTKWRVRVFFNNPNGLAAFFTLLIALYFVGLVTTTGRKRILYMMATVLSAAAIITTLSRSGVLAAAVALGVLLILHYRDLSPREISVLVIGGVTALGAMAVLLRDRVTRFVEWISFEGGSVALAGGQASKSFRTRFRLLEKAADLFAEAPMFGYGWFASPSRVGYLDNLYAILLVELGLPGFVLIISLFLIVIRMLLRARTGGARYLSGAVLAWFLGLLVMGIGGPYARSPHMMMLWILLIVTVQTAAVNSTVKHHLFPDRTRRATIATR